ncbi:MAG TPA: flavodoxin family protein [Desulfobacteria bacterium]|nr:flavodoxin family protein [Desulfobacteria bacterium]
MKVFAINGSFRKEGNTDIIIDKILEGAKTEGAETEKVFIDDLIIKSCQGCLKCRQDGICPQTDDLSAVVKNLEQADAIVVGSPIYGNYMTGQLKILLDRLMGVISKVTYIPGGGIKSITRLEPKKRNIVSVLTAGAPTPECADDALKLLRRMLGSLANEGAMEEIIAVGINPKGAIVFPKEEWMEAAKKYGLSEAEREAYAEKAMARDREVLLRAYEIGKNLVR